MINSSKEDETKLIQKIKQNNAKVMIVSDRSFYPNKSYLVIAFILALVGSQIILKVRFITTISLDYQHLIFYF